MALKHFAFSRILMLIFYFETMHFLDCAGVYPFLKDLRVAPLVERGRERRGLNFSKPVVGCPLEVRFPCNQRRASANGPSAARHEIEDAMASREAKEQKIELKTELNHLQALRGSFSAVSKPSFASKHSLENS